MDKTTRRKHRHVRTEQSQEFFFTFLTLKSHTSELALPTLSHHHKSRICTLSRLEEKNNQ